MKRGELVRLVPDDPWSHWLANRHGYLWLVYFAGDGRVLCESLATKEVCGFNPSVLEQANEEG